MLRSISWSAFWGAFVLLALIYYGVVGFLYFRKEIKVLIRRWAKIVTVLVMVMVGSRYWVHAQDANTGINEANTLVRSYFDASTQLMLAIGAIIGLVGAVRVFRVLMSDHREDAGKTAAAWFGSCIFLVIVSAVIKSFFGL